MNASGKSTVSIIVVNWNGEEWLRDCIESLSNQTYPVTEINLVDNGPTDASLSTIEECLPRVRIVALPNNRGFTGGCTEGLKRSRGDLVALINNAARGRNLACKSCSAHDEALASWNLRF